MTVLTKLFDAAEHLRTDESRKNFIQVCLEDKNFESLEQEVEVLRSVLTILHKSYE